VRAPVGERAGENADRLVDAELAQLLPRVRRAGLEQDLGEAEHVRKVSAMTGG
jgi:hypothetical protein